MSSVTSSGRGRVGRRRHRRAAFHHRPRPVDEIDYYVILARFKLAIVLEGGYARVVKGEADNPKMAWFGNVVLDMARKAAELSSTTSLR